LTRSGASTTSTLKRAALVGFYPPDEDGVSVVFASGPGHNGKHASGQVQLSHPSEIEAPVDGLVWVGDWHSEPTRWDA
jgi:hypothetical protein